MKETFVPRNSTNVARVEYDSDSQVLTVEFSNGGVYEHKGVPQSVFMGMQTTSSVGGYYHRQVKGRYETARV